MSLPHRDAIKQALIDVIRLNGGRIRTSQAYDRVADYLDLSNEDRDNNMKRQDNLWENELRWARQALVEERILLSVAQSGRGVWKLHDKHVSADTSLRTISETHAVELDRFIPDPEGRKMIVQSVQYERSRKNRERALQTHGRVCKVCGFDFNKVYGKDLAQDFIEVHHVRPVSGLCDQGIDPDKDLIPLCSNCHSMVHRRSGTVVSIEELSKRINKGKSYGH